MEEEHEGVVKDWRNRCGTIPLPSVSLCARVYLSGFGPLSFMSHFLSICGHKIH